MALASSQLVHLPLSRAFLCQDCSEIGNSANWCPACSSTALLPLARVLDRTAEIKPVPMLGEVY
jgi:hypothetical protein